MDTAKIEELKQLLLKTKKALQEQEFNSKEEAKPVKLDQTMVGRLSRMDAMQIQEMALEASRRRKQHIQKIESTLNRIEMTDDYGYCFGCDEEIDIRRLFVDPTNTHCIQCADK